MVEWVLSFAASFLSSNPYFGTFVMIMGLCRVAFKPLMILIQTIVAQTETKKDDQAVSAFIASDFYKGIVFLLDWIASIKLPKSKLVEKK